MARCRLARQPHSPRQFRPGRAYTERLAEAGIEPSVGSVGDSYDNALAETINGLYKAEVIHRRGPWRSFEALELATPEWVDWTNHRRLLEPIGNIPPAEAEERYYAQLADQDQAACFNPTSLRQTRGGSGTNLIVGRVTASQIAAASAASFFAVERKASHKQAGSAERYGPISRLHGPSGERLHRPPCRQDTAATSPTKRENQPDGPLS